MELRGKTAIVTGGAVRIGRQLAIALAGEGMNVGLHYGHSREEAEATLKEICDRGVKACMVQADFERPIEGAQTLFETVNQNLGPVSVLVNSAAIFEDDQLSTATLEHWDKHFDINLKSPFFLCQAFASQLPAGESGQIVNIVDWRAERPGSSHLVYTLTKSALATLTKSLAQHLAPEIRVNAIAPGAILPPPGATEAEWKKSAVKRNLLKITGDPQKIADALLYLLHADFVTGEILHVTGGEAL